MEDIRKQIELAGIGVDAISYRAQHEELLDSLDELQRLGLLRREQDRYWVTFQGLLLLKDDKSRVLLQNCERIFQELRNHYKSNPRKRLLVTELAQLANVTFRQAAECLGYMCESYSLGSHTTEFDNPSEAFIEPAETILRHKSFREIISESISLKQKHQTSSRKSRLLYSTSHGDREGNSATNFAGFNPNQAWKGIRREYEMDKKAFSNKIAFVSDPFKKEIIFRDVAQAFELAKAGFSKPAVILAGSVVEELLRLFLELKGAHPANNTFDAYIRACAETRLLKSAIHRLTDSVRHFRNLVHLQNEELPRHTISKATAKGAVASIFTIVNDFH